MKPTTSQIVIVGHNYEKLFLSIDKEVFDCLIFISEKETLTGSEKASEAVSALMEEYSSRKVKVYNHKISFTKQTKAVAELVHLIYQLKLQGMETITLNVSGGLRYINIWTYLACSMTNTRIIHADFIYEGDREVGITKNSELPIIAMETITDRQFEFLSLFFKNDVDKSELFGAGDFDENPAIMERNQFESIEKLLSAYNEKKKGSNVTRGSINGYIKKMERISALEMVANVQNKKKIRISYLGIAFFMQKAYYQ